MIDATCVQTTYKYLVFEVAVTLSKFCWNVPGSLNLKVGMQWFLQSCNLTRQDIAPNFLSSQGFMLLSRLQIQPKFTSQHFGIQATKPEMRLLNMHKLHFISLHLFFWFLQPFMFFFVMPKPGRKTSYPLVPGQGAMGCLLQVSQWEDDGLVEYSPNSLTKNIESVWGIVFFL